MTDFRRPTGLRPFARSRRQRLANELLDLILIRTRRIQRTFEQREHRVAVGAGNRAMPHDPQQQRRERIRARLIAIRSRIAAEELLLASERPEAPRLRHRADVVSHRREPAIHDAALVHELRQRAPLQIRTGTRITDDVDEKRGGVVVGELDHLPKRARDLRIRFLLLMKHLGHDVQLHHRGRVKRNVAMPVRAIDRGRLRDIDDADRKVVRRQLRKILQRLLRRMPHRQLQRRILGQIGELAKVGESGSGDEEKDGDDSNAHTGIVITRSRGDAEDRRGFSAPPRLRASA